MARQMTWIVLGMLFLAGSLFLSPKSYSQAISGDLVGTVSDSSGATVPNASITAENVGTGFKADQATNAAGEFHFSNLPVGTYKVTATPEVSRQLRWLTSPSN